MELHRGATKMVCSSTELVHCLKTCRQQVTPTALHQSAQDTKLHNGVCALTRSPRTRSLPCYLQSHHHHPSTHALLLIQPLRQHRVGNTACPGLFLTSIPQYEPYCRQLCMSCCQRAHYRRRIAPRCDAPARPHCTRRQHARI